MIEQSKRIAVAATPGADHTPDASSQQERPLAWLWEVTSDQGYVRVIRATWEVDPARQPYPEGWKPIGPVADAPDPGAAFSAFLKAYRAGQPLDEAFSQGLRAAPSASAQQAGQAIGWTDDADANAALLMLDRLDVSGEDDARVDAIAATIRRLAATTPSASPASAQQDERLKALRWLDDSTADPLEKARRVLRHLMARDVYFFEDGFPRWDDLSRNAGNVLAVLDSLAARQTQRAAQQDERGAVEQWAAKSPTTPGEWNAFIDGYRAAKQVQAEGEAVAWRLDDEFFSHRMEALQAASRRDDGMQPEPLYTHPSPATEGASTGALTDEQIRAVAQKYGRFVSPGVYSITEFDCEEDLFNCVRALLAASPADQDARDAARYRFIRATTKAVRRLGALVRVEVTPEEFDAMTDSAMSASKEGE